MKSQSWGEPVILINAPKSISWTSVSTYPELSLAFSDFKIDLPAGEGPILQSQVFVARVPLVVKTEFAVVGFVVDFGFSGERTGNTRVGVTVECAGTTKSLQFPRTFERQSLQEMHRIFSAPSIGTAGGGVIGTHGPEYPDLMVAILITAQRDSVDNHILLQFDNIDVTAIVATGFATDENGE